MASNKKETMEEVYNAVMSLKRSVTHLRDEAERYQAEGEVAENDLRDTFINQMIALSQADKIVDLLERFD